MADLIAKVTAWALSLKPVRVWFHYLERRGLMLADSVTYRTLFSAFAAVLLGFSFAALWLGDNPAAWQALVSTVEAAVPGLIGEDGVIKVESIQAPVGLTVAGILALVGLVGASIGAIGSLRAGLRTLADEIHDDAFWVWVILRNLLLAIAIGGGFVLSAAVTFYGATFIETTANWFGAQEFVADIATQALAILAVFILDAAVIALAFVVLSGVKARPRRLIVGSLIGAVGLTVLQQLSGLFVRGAGANPLFATFAALIALLLWFNLSAQVILLASTWIIVGIAEDHDRVRERYGATTFELRRVRRAENAVRVATTELNLARTVEEKTRQKS
ncbi:YihY/virulence factor BrkB family protein [Microbacterium sp. CFBP9034]|uniref:YihY/virulence factor BrkB family protein n=1 Tax=Microbacterium sp. CFBP9034 TaxID=3096540 RepID=UPI002A6A8070|nr:YihY/virulence factor BrkB family protein [Microbacterium sp. CFBP9034]MDY0910033.1 YihY/virulence factor BrkB family protein [Microbacterium sp. CFBP9034]